MTTPASSCLNCDSPLQPGKAWCSVCGQKADTHRLQLHDIGHALVHMLTHADHSVFSLVRDLAFKPGHVAREYVKGRRRKYFNPFTFVLVVVGVASLMLAATKFVDFTSAAPPNPVSDFLQRHINLLILVQLPLLTLFTSLLFRKERLNLAEHLALASYTSGFRSIFVTLVMAPVWALTQWNYAMMVTTYLLIWLLYFSMACAQFFEGNRWWLACKGFAAGALAQITISFAIWLAFFLWFEFFRR